MPTVSQRSNTDAELLASILSRRPEHLGRQICLCRWASQADRCLNSSILDAERLFLRNEPPDITPVVKQPNARALITARQLYSATKSRLTLAIQASR